MQRLVSAYCNITVDVPTSVGRIADNGQGFARNLGFIEPRSRQLMGYGAELEPGIDYTVWQLYSTRMAHSVNGLSIAEIVQPRDMAAVEWDYRADVSGSVTIAYVADDLDRAWWYLDAADDTSGQNLGYLTGNTGSAASGTASPTHTQRNKVRFVSHWGIGDGQGWEYREVRYGSFGSEVLPLSGFLEGPGGSVMQPVTVVDPTVGVVTREPIHHSATFIFWSVGSNPTWCLALPTNRSVWGAMLLKSVDGGDHYSIVDRHSLSYAFFGGHQSVGPQENRVRYCVENGTAVFHIGDDPIPWRYRDPDDPGGFEAPVGRVGVFWAGGVGAWNLSPILAPTVAANTVLGGAITGPFSLHDLPWVNSDPADASVKILPANASTSSVNMTADIITGAQLVAAGINNPAVPNDASVYWVEVTATTTGGWAGPIQVPIVLGVQEIRRAKVVRTTGSVGNLSADTLEVQWASKKRRRDGQVTLVVKNETGQWDGLKKNQVVTLQVSRILADEGGATTSEALTTLFTGFIYSVTRAKGSRYAGTPGVLEITLRDWGFKLSDKKLMRDMPSFGGWELKDALEYICNRCGIDPLYYEWSSVGTGWVLDTPQVADSGRGHLSFFYNDQVRPAHAMDEMMASKGWEWYIDRLGVLLPRQVGVNDLSYNYIFDDTTAPAGTDLLREISSGDDAEGFYNNEVVYSRGLDGAEVSARRQDHGSIYDSANLNYVGDDWWDSHHAPPGINPGPYADLRSAMLVRPGRRFAWKTDLNLLILPNQIVTVNTPHLGFSVGTSLEVLEEGGILRWGQDPLFESSFVLGSPVGI